MLQNRWEAATLHWACQFAGIIITPLNWRATADELDFCIENAEAKAMVYEDVAADAVPALARPRSAAAHRGRAARRAGEIAFADMIATGAADGDAARRRPKPGR